jgi:hypothetical protein
MPKSKSKSPGPMNMQPVAHGSTVPTQSLMMPTAAAATKTTLPKKQSPRNEAVRIAKVHHAAQFAAEAAAGPEGLMPAVRQAKIAPVSPVDFLNRD